MLLVVRKQYLTRQIIWVVVAAASLSLKSSIIRTSLCRTVQKMVLLPRMVNPPTPAQIWNLVAINRLKLLMIKKRTKSWRLWIRSNQLWRIIVWRVPPFRKTASWTIYRRRSWSSRSSQLTKISRSETRRSVNANYAPVHGLYLWLRLTTWSNVFPRDFSHLFLKIWKRTSWIGDNTWNFSESA